MNHRQVYIAWLSRRERVEQGSGPCPQQVGIGSATEKALVIWLRDRPCQTGHRQMIAVWAGRIDGREEPCGPLCQGPEHSRSESQESSGIRAECRCRGVCWHNDLAALAQSRWPTGHLRRSLAIWARRPRKSAAFGSAVRTPRSGRDPDRRCVRPDGQGCRCAASDPG